MSLPRDLVARVRRLDEPQLRRLGILVRGLLADTEAAAHPDPTLPDVTYRQQRVRCGRDCGACPHGPYWYAFWHEDGRRRSLYIGAELPAQVRRRLEG